MEQLVDEVNAYTKANGFRAVFRNTSKPGTMEIVTTHDRRTSVKQKLGSVTVEVIRANGRKFTPVSTYEAKWRDRGEKVGIPAEIRGWYVVEEDRAEDLETSVPGIEPFIDLEEAKPTLGAPTKFRGKDVLAIEQKSDSQRVITYVAKEGPLCPLGRHVWSAPDNHKLELVIEKCGTDVSVAIPPDSKTLTAAQLNERVGLPSSAK
ncbi:hypothetical protein [Embleya sp. NBC_00896]|uniref:hypothetical protein n=1 Tax=Embleya sp. NBC_00896 TaxID=2975961 RepID=UPI003863746E|nr:hypothetical protein OG928_38715 [Embleya sp. NBC_00896]